MKAVWNGEIIAESNDIVTLDGYNYFPKESVNMLYLERSETLTRCHWKGIASYYNIVVGENTNKDAAWYYPDPSDLAKSIKGRIAFWNGVQLL